MSKIRVLLLSLLTLFALTWTTAQAAPGDTTADAVLGQLNFTNNSPNAGGSVSASGLDWPYGMVVDPAAGRLYLADYKNNRVLSWPSAESFSSGAPADKVLGQPNLTANLPNQGGAPAANTLNGPVGLAVDPQTGRLFVAEYLNHRVVSYAPPITTNMAADRVYGQPDFTTNLPNNGGISADSLEYPWDVALDEQGRLYVSDYGNNRVLAYYASPTNTTAYRVFGQPNYTSDTANNGGVSAGSLSSPTGLAIPLTPNSLIVADANNNRVLWYDLDEPDVEADVVMGQNGSFTTALPNNGGLGPESLWLPTDVAFDSGHSLYVADRNNSRVLRYSTAVPVSDTATHVFGQPDFTSNTINNGGVSADSLSQPFGLVLTPGEHLLVADRNNHRVLRYDQPQPNPLPSLGGIAPTQVAVGSPTFQLLVYGSKFTSLSSVTWNGQTRPTTYLNAGELLVTIPASDVAVTFTGIIRVVNPAPGGGTTVSQGVVSGYAAQPHDQTADRVLGQPDFSANLVNSWMLNGLGPRSLSGPQGTAVDPNTGRLYISDSGNDRVLSWPSAASFTNADPADLVLGQPDLYSNYSPDWANLSASDLRNPVGLVVDGSSNLYVADGSHNRVLLFLNPAATNTVADFVFGQPDFSSFTANNGGISANSLNGPHDVALTPAGSLVVADSSNHRVLIYHNPLTSDRTADVVIGQPDFTSGVGSVDPTAANLSGPRGVAVDGSGRLYVADYFFNRVLVFNAPLTNNAAADFVLGQPDFTSGAANNGGLGPDSLHGAREVTVDPAGTVFVSDYLNNRVLAYLSPVAANDRTADYLFGQPDFNSNQPNQGSAPSAGSLNNPSVTAVGPGGDLFIADSYNHRVLSFDSPIPTSTFTTFLPAVLKP